MLLQIQIALHPVAFVTTLYDYNHMTENANSLEIVLGICICNNIV